MTGDTSLPSVKMINALSPIFFSFAVVSSWRKGKPGEISDGSTTFWREPPGSPESCLSRSAPGLKSAQEEETGEGVMGDTRNVAFVPTRTVKAQLVGFFAGGKLVVVFGLEGNEEGFHDARLFHAARRSEEHTSELQSLRHLVCRLLLEKTE